MNVMIMVVIMYFMAVLNVSILILVNIAMMEVSIMKLIINGMILCNNLLKMFSNATIFKGLYLSYTATQDNLAPKPFINGSMMGKMKKWIGKKGIKL